LSKIIKPVEIIWHERTDGSSYSEKIPGEVRCSCGAIVEIWDCWLNVCDVCGTDYDGSGNQLAPRCQWGEETGEHYTDITNL
jgi:hypothetical protein